MVKLGIFRWLMVLAAAAMSHFAEATARDHVAAVAQQIRQHYYDETLANRYAAQLEQEAQQGLYDQYQHKAELATALTTRLQTLDGHFAVSYVTAQPTVLTRDVFDARYNLQRQNYGVQKIEILPGNIGYLELNSFVRPDFSQPQAGALGAINAALAMLANSSALIIDLRKNGGGSPQMVGYLVSAFTKADAAIYNNFRQRQGSYSEAPSHFYANPRLDIPLYILLSGRSASAAEGFSYTLQAAKRAVIVGQPSAGGANPGDTFNAGQGFSVFVSTGSPVNPITGKNWEGTGVIPDHLVSVEQALPEAQRLVLHQLLHSAPEHPLSPLWRWNAEALQVKTQTLLSSAEYTGDYQGLTIALVEGRLQMLRGKRPVQNLTLLRSDVFLLSDSPDVRLHFERNEDHKIHAVELRTVNGQLQRFARSQ